MTFQPSPQQADVFKFIATQSGNAFVEAVAGAGKTTTLVHACKLLSDKRSIAFAAYNKKIALEIGAKTKAAGLTNVQAGTFHSFGYSAVRKVFDKAKLDERAKWNLICLNTGMNEAYAAFAKRAVSLAKNNALRPERAGDSQFWLDLVAHFALDDMLGEEEGRTAEETLASAIAAAQKAFAAGNDLRAELIDFDDMIYLALIYCAKQVWQHDIVMVDEAQDTNPARRELARLMVRKGGRIFFVGDRHQAIYGFTGADADAVDQIIKSFACTRLPLTVTYRCPKSVVKAAQQYVSHIQAHESAPEGEVNRKTYNEFAKGFAALGPQDAILCRKTKPLVALAYDLIRNRIACHVEGRDIGKGLIDLTNQWKRIKSVGPFLAKLLEVTEKKAAKFEAQGKDSQAEALRDRYETMVVICSGKQTLDEVRTAINELFQDTEEGTPSPNLTLSTVHKAKGREWGSVYVYGFADYMPSPMAKQAWEIEQENNLIYVAFTRAQSTLTLVG
jgi:superfamily I DNA/RNA helicase